MTFNIETQPGLSIACLGGHVDTLNAGELENTLVALADTGENQLLVDCTSLDYINSAGLRVFLLVAKRKEATGGKCSFCGLTTNVRLVFETIGFDRILTVYESRAAALAQIQPLSQAAA